jgi:hypothetical protein
MNAIRIRKQIHSEALHLPELKPLLGKQVEIIVLEEPSPEATAANRCQPLIEATGQDSIHFLRADSV